MEVISTTNGVNQMLAIIATVIVIVAPSALYVLLSSNSDG